MYCSHCGTENENTAKFCRQCGNALQANAQSNSAPSAFEQEISASKGRQSVANFLRAFQAHVAPQAKNYSVLNAQCSQMEMLERQRADFEKSVKSPVLLILGIVLIALGIGLIASFVSYMQAHIDEAVIIENPTLADYLDTFVAVSYTHLDVYKRQAHDSRLRVQAACQTNISLANKRAKQAPICIGQPVFAGASAIFDFPRLGRNAHSRNRKMLPR